MTGEIGFFLSDGNPDSDSGFAPRGGYATTFTEEHVDINTAPSKKVEVEVEVEVEVKEEAAEVEAEAEAKEEAEDDVPLTPPKNITSADNKKSESKTLLKEIPETRKYARRQRRRKLREIAAPPSLSSPLRRSSSEANGNGPSGCNSESSSQQICATALQKTQKATEKVYVGFEKTLGDIIKEYAQENSSYGRKLLNLTSTLEDLEAKNNNENDTSQSSEATALNNLALSIGQTDETDSSSVKDYIKNISLSTYCVAKTVKPTSQSSEKSSEKKYKRLFLHAILGVSHSNPKKWSAWKILLFTAVIAILTTALLAGAFSIACVVIHIGTNAASTMGIWSLFQKGWIILTPYKHLIPMSCGFFCSFLSGRRFRKTPTETAISCLEKEIQPNPEQGLQPYPNEMQSLNLLDDAIKNIENNSELQINLRKLHASLLEGHAKFHHEKAAFKNYLNPIIFAATLFSRSVVEHQNNPSDLTAQKKKLLFDALMGASLAQEPTEDFFLKHLTPWIPAFIIMGLSFAAFIPVYLVGYISLNAALLVSPLFSLLSLLPSTEAESTLSNKVKNYFLPNKIQLTVFSIEKMLKLPMPVETNTEGVSATPSLSHCNDATPEEKSDCQNSHSSHSENTLRQQRRVVVVSPIKESRRTQKKQRMKDYKHQNASDTQHRSRLFSQHNSDNSVAKRNGKQLHTKHRFSNSTRQSLSSSSGSPSS